jgi:hypothetical protein
MGGGKGLVAERDRESGKTERSKGRKDRRRRKKKRERERVESGRERGELSGGEKLKIGRILCGIGFMAVGVTNKIFTHF